MADYSIKGDTKLDTSGVSSGLSAMTTAAGTLIAGCVETIASGVKDAAQQVYSLGTEFETASAKLATIAGTDAVAGLTADITALSNETGAASADLADVAYNAISAGVAVDDAVSTAGTASKLATAGFTDTSSALSVLTTAMNAYGDSAGTAEQISDSLITVQNLGVTTVAELSSSMGKAIASASAYGVNLYNLESGYISLTKAGISTAEGTTYLSSMFKELGDSGSSVGQIIQEKTGKSFGQLMADGYSLGDVLGILNDSVDGDSEALMNLWGSAEAGKAASAIVGQGLDAFNENLNTLENSAGATESAYSIMADTMEYKTGVLQTNVQNLAISMYESFADNLSPIVDFGIDCVQQLADGFNEGGTTGLINAAGSVMSACLSKLAEYLPEVINVGVQLLTSLLQGLMNSLPDLVSAAGQIIETLIDTVLDFLPDFLSAGLDFIGEMIDGIVQKMPSIISSITTVINKLISTLASNLPSFLSKGVEIIGKMASGILNNLPTIISSLTSILTNLISTIVTNLPQFLSKGIEIIGKLAAGLIQAIPTAVAAIPEIIKSSISAFTSTDWGSVGKNIISGIAKGITSGVSSIVNAAKEAAKSALNAAKSFLGIKSPSRKARDEVGAMFDEGIAGGVEDNADQMVDAATDSADQMIAAAQDVVVRQQMQVGDTYSATGSRSTASVISAQSGGASVQSDSDLSGLLSKMLALMDAYLPNVGNAKIVLDDDTLVGKTVGKMDKALGDLTKKKGRGA
jgi:TP901 family phage tail tape measure protein